MLTQRPWVQIRLKFPPPLIFFFRLVCNHCLDCYYNNIVVGRYNCCNYYNNYICKWNPLTKDRCEKGAWWNWRELQASLEGTHDNPMSGTNQALSHWDLHWRNAQILTKKHPKGRKDWAQKMRKQHRNMSKMIDYRKSAVKNMLKPKVAPYSISDGDRCLNYI